MRPLYHTSRLNAIGRENFGNDFLLFACICAHFCAGAAADGIYGYETELDYENGVMMYDIEFHADGREYEYKIDAMSGEVLRSKNKNDNDRVFSSAGSAPDVSGTIGDETAKSVL